MKILKYTNTMINANTHRDKYKMISWQNYRNSYFHKKSTPTYRNDTPKSTFRPANESRQGSVEARERRRKGWHVLCDMHLILTMILWFFPTIYFFAAHPILQLSQKLAEGFSGTEVILGESYQIPIHYQIPERNLLGIMEILRNDLWDSWEKDIKTGFFSMSPA